MILDLNAKRAARAAARGEPMQMVLSDEYFTLVDAMPIEVGALAREGKMDQALRIMLADPDGDWDRLLKCRPTFDDIVDVLEYIGTSVGESVRSIETSTGTGEPSQPISTATTDVISELPVTDPSASEPEISPVSSVPSQQTPPTDES